MPARMTLRKRTRNLHWWVACAIVDPVTQTEGFIVAALSVFPCDGSFYSLNGPIAWHYALFSFNSLLIVFVVAYCAIRAVVDLPF